MSRSAAPPVTMTMRMRRVGVRRHRGRVATALPVLAIGFVCWQALDDAVAGQHATIHREVPADHEGAHRRVLACQLVRFVRQIRLVLPPVDQHQAGVPARVPEHVVGGLFPSAAVAEACGNLRQPMCTFLDTLRNSVLPRGPPNRFAPGPREVLLSTCTPSRHAASIPIHHLNDACRCWGGRCEAGGCCEGICMTTQPCKTSSPTTRYIWMCSIRHAGSTGPRVLWLKPGFQARDPSNHL